MCPGCSCAGTASTPPLERGCFRYRAPADRPVYADDVNEAVISVAFAAWRVKSMEGAAVPGDTRLLDVIIAACPLQNRHDHLPAHDEPLARPCNPDGRARYQR